MRWIKKIGPVPVLLVILIVLANIVTIGLLYRRGHSEHASVSFDKPDKIVICQGEKTRTLQKGTPEYKELYTRNEQRCSQVDFLRLRHDGLADSENQLIIQYEYNTPHPLHLQIHKKILDISAKQVSFTLTGENYDTVGIAGDTSGTYGALPADKDLIEYAAGFLA